MRSVAGETETGIITGLCCLLDLRSKVINVVDLRECKLYSNEITIIHTA